MGIINAARNVVGGTIGFVGKMITPKKKPVIPSRYHTTESVDDYRRRLMKSRSDRG